MIERGLATTEATVVLPVLALLAGGLLHLHGLLHTRLDAQHDARGVAWKERDGEDCGRRDRDVRDADGGPDFPGEVAELVPGGLSVVFAYGRAEAQLTRVAQLAPLFPGDVASRRVSARAVVSCNEPAQTGLVGALAGILKRVSGR